MAKKPGKKKISKISYQKENKTLAIAMRNPLFTLYNNYSWNRVEYSTAIHRVNSGDLSDLRKKDKKEN